MKLTLALLVAWVLADDTHDALAADDAAGLTKLFDGWTYSHFGVIGRKQKRSQTLWQAGSREF